MTAQTRLPARALACVLLLAVAGALAACGGGGGGSAVDTVVPGSLGSGKTWLIKPGSTATQEMVEAMVGVVPGDVIQFDCGFFDLKTTLQLANTEGITIRGCGRDKTVLSFKDSETQFPVGILAVNVHGLLIQDLTVADTDGNGFELRAVDHGTLQRVRAFWSSGGGNQSADPISASNFADGRLNVSCTQPATLDPRSAENSGRPETESPDYTVSDKAGRYGIYPVSSDNILVEFSESIGASDAGIYVGQTNNTIIRNSRSAYNVFGFEIENVQGGEYHDNIAECNTGGFLVYDLDGNLRQYGDRTRMYKNISRNNNSYNFTEGGFVSNVPPGSGMITLSYDRIDIFENTFENNNTGGIIHASYELFPEGAGRPTEKRIDWYTEGVHIFKNVFRNNGNHLPTATTNDLQNGDVARLLPALVGYKNQAACAQPTNLATCAAAGGSDQSATGYRGAHIVWDGLLDALDADCAYPKRPDGTDVPHDERGKPLHTNQEDPECHYNAYKFKASGDRARIVPDWFASCIDEDNDFSEDSLRFSNFHGTKGANAAIAIALWASGQSDPTNPTPPPPPTPAQIAEYQEFPASFDIMPHHCMATYGKSLPLLPAVVITPYVPSGGIDAAPTAEEVAQLCEAIVPDGKVNFDAARVNCPRLDQYHLFSDAEDPRSTPNSSVGDYDASIPGIPFVLNTKLFSDYAVKYRVLFMPTGSKAIYKDASTDGANATIIFPVGTIIAKSFAFADESAGTENVVETRLLIKRVNSSTHQPRWDGLVYIWKTDTDGKRYAELSPTGGSASVSWNFHDADSGVQHTGSTNYQVPNQNQCLACHSREDSEPGAAPIGPKVRNINRPYRSESAAATGQAGHEIKDQNQVAYLCSKGLMLGCPADLGVDATSKYATKIERLPIFNKPGDAGFAANSGPDVESRARAYLEVNCQHCHNVKGFAASTGLYLNSIGSVGQANGICKHPTASGAEGSGGFSYDIVPGDPDHSIVPFRISPAASSASARMPPLARTVVHDEGYQLVTQWIRDVIVADNSKYPNSENCH